jgi:general stress protein 26
MNQELITKAGKIIAQNTGSGGYCTLAQIDLDGYPTAAAISVSKADGIKWLTFCGGLDSNKAKRTEKNNRTAVCFDSLEHNITLVGTMEVITDPAIKKEMWYEGLENHFSGADDPGYCVFRFTTERYNLFIDWQEARGEL